MILSVILVVLSLVILYFGADFLVKGSSSMAVRAGISPLVVGLTVVALGTSAPELVVSVKSALDGISSIAVGNVIGSNIFNICVILGISAMIYPLQVDRRLIRIDTPIMLVASLLFVVLFSDGRFGRLSGILFLVGIAGYMFLCVYKAKKGEVIEGEQEMKPTKSWLLDVVLVIGGLFLLVWGSDMLVKNAVVIAKTLGWSEAVIGLTIVAAGTSMPELATSVVAALKKRTDIAIGNVIGSNIFNLFAVLGATATITPIQTDQINILDMAVMLGSAVIVLPFMRTGFRIERWEGILLFAVYLIYTVYLLV
ncbi:calcium/sodium antiporter [uncultured Sanguibacteroides sp.]|uniref:calcium/sodium antiporter n=1 Tax=uncultured Sanguibacteroides sp. TaxID=1635151 RepID=UPI0025FAB56B|nr:calcium/sodium antiporter [uncultured Sanguibacteroides sp.]